jgi:hypothetical protein
LKNNLLETRQSDSSNEEAGSGTSIKQTKTTTCSRIIMRIEKKKVRHLVVDEERKQNIMMLKG